MRVPISASLAAVTLATAVTLTACASPPPQATSGPSPSPGDPTPAAALARQLLARLILPPGARRLPQTPVPSSLTTPFTGNGDVTPSLDQYQLFALTQPMAAAAAFLATHVPSGLDQGGTGSGGGPGGVTMQEVTYSDHEVPAGIAGAQLVLTVVPASAGSLLRADAQITWYPPRTAAEYIDPARYHVLSITVSIWGRHPHTVHQIVTSQAFITRLASALNRMRAEPLGTIACPAIFAEYRLAFSVSRTSRPVVVVTANETGCGGAGITVNGRPQPPLTDPGTVAALIDQVVRVAWQL
jgi:hypothetical protein